MTPSLPLLALAPLLLLAAIALAPHAGGDAVRDRYEIDLVSPSSYRVAWTAAVEEMHVDGADRSWENITENGLETEAGDIALQAALDTIGQMWWGVTVSAGPVQVTGEGFSAGLVVTASRRTWAMEAFDVKSVDDVINATLEMGGTAGLLVNLVALDGHETTARYVAPGLMIPLLDRNETIDGIAGAAQRVFIIGLNGTGSVADMLHGFEAVGEMPDYFNVTVRANVTHFSLDPAEHGLALPPSLTVLRVSAGGMRVYVENGFTTWEKVTEATERNITTEGASLNEVVSEAFEGNASFVFAWAPGTLGPFPYVPGTLAMQPPLVGQISADIAVGKFDVDAETITGFLNAGGWFTFEMEADLEGYDHVIRFVPPPGLWVDTENGTQDGDAGVWNGTGMARMDASLRAVGAPLDHGNDSRLLVDIDLSDVRLLEGKVNYRLEAVGEIRWIRITQEIADNLPRNVDIRAVPADLVRLMYSKGLITDEDVDGMADRVTEGLGESSFQGALRVNFSNYRQAVDVDHMDGEPAVVFRVRSEGTLGMGGAESTLAAITVPFEFELASERGWRTTYEVLLPEGLSISDMEVSEGDISRKTAGLSHRLIVEIPEDAGSVVVSITLTVGLWFLIDQFCTICSIVLIVLVLLLLLKAWRIHKDNKRRRDDDEFVRHGLAAMDAIARGEAPPPRGSGPPDPGPSRELAGARDIPADRSPHGEGGDTRQPWDGRGRGPSTAPAEHLRGKERERWPGRGEDAPRAVRSAGPSPGGPAERRERQADGPPPEMARGSATGPPPGDLPEADAPVVGRPHIEPPGRTAGGPREPPAAVRDRTSGTARESRRGREPK